MEDRARSRYQGLQGQRYHQSKRSVPDRAFPWIARLRAEKITPSLRPEDVVLEYGVGLGWNLAALPCARRIGYDVADFVQDQLLAHKIEFISEPGLQPPASVDVVVCHHTLEHVSAPGDVLRTIHALLRPGGQLLLFVPYEKERRYHRFDPTEPNHHLYSWNVQTLGNLVQEAGFVVENARIAPFGQERFAANLACRLHFGERAFRFFRWTANSLKREFEVRIRARRS